MEDSFVAPPTDPYLVGVARDATEAFNAGAAGHWIQNRVFFLDL